MGGEESKPKKSTYLKDFPDSYRVIKNINSQPYGAGTVYVRIDNPTQYIIAKSYGSQQNAQPWCPTKIEHPLVLNCLGSLSYGDDQQLCGTNNIDKYFYPYYPKTLQGEIQKRSETDSKFTEEELWYLFFSLVQIGYALQKLNKYHGDIRPVNILLTENNQIRMAPYGTFPKDLTGYQKASQGQTIYLSPEQLRFLSEKANVPYINQFKSDVFSVGITMLEAMSLIQGCHFYNYQKIQVDEDRIKIMLEKQLDDYSELFVKTIAQLFTKNTEKRPDFNQLYNMLEPYSIKIQKLEPFDYDIKEANRKYSMSPQKHCPPQEYEQVEVEYQQPQKTIYVVQQSQILQNDIYQFRPKSKFSPENSLYVPQQFQTQPQEKDEKQRDSRYRIVQKEEDPEPIVIQNSVPVQNQFRSLIPSIQSVQSVNDLFNLKSNQLSGQQRISPFLQQSIQGRFPPSAQQFQSGSTLNQSYRPAAQNVPPSQYQVIRQNQPNNRFA